MLHLTGKTKNNYKRITTTAGILYLVVIITGMFSLAYVPKKTIDWNHAALTFNNVNAHAVLFRLGIFSSVICYLAFTFLILLLYKLLRVVNMSYAIAMITLALLSVPLSLYNLQHSYAVLTLTSKESFFKNLTTENLQNMLMLSMHQYNNGILLTSLFWGLWLFPFGILVYRSGFIPSFLGVLLMLGCIGYLTNFTANTLFEAYAATGIGSYVSMLPAVAEISTCLWLLLSGYKK